MRVAIQSQHAPAGSASIEQVVAFNLGPVARTQVIRIGVIVVYPDNVRCTAFPSVVANHRSRRIQCLRQAIQGLDSMAVSSGGRQIRYTPRFVERNPVRDTWMTIVVLDRLGPFADHAIDGTSREAVRRWHLPPYDEPESIRPVQVARILDLLVLAHAIEAHCLRK